MSQTWIIHRLIKDKRCTDGVRFLAIGWVCSEDETQAREEAHKMFRRFDQEQLKLLLTTPGCGWLV